MQCPNCRHQNTASAKFCENCGFKLQTTDDRPQPIASTTASSVVSHPSPFSTFPSPEIARLEKLVPKEFAARLLQSRTGRIEGERRIVTILFCDVKGSTALGEERDPEEILEIMNGAFDFLIEPIYRYEGTLARLMGDAILAFFGAPIAHEDDPERACLAALAIQEKIAEYGAQVRRTYGIENFAVRVGINTGLVVVGEVGSDLRVEYTAMGDAINLASRMEQSAEPGTIVIAENTARLARHAMELESLGALHVKGKTEPVNAYRVVGVRAERESRRGIAGLTSPLVGRAHELNLLQECVRRTVNGQGQIVAVIGEAGLGKSRLIAELRKATQDKGWRTDDSFVTGPTSLVQWFEAHSLSYETQTPYAPFVDLFHRIFEIRAGESDAEAYEKIKTQLDGLVGARAVELAPFAATMLGIRLTGEDFERVQYLMPPFLRGHITRSVAEILGAFAIQHPAVIVFEDLHWTDATSLEMLGALLPLVENAPVMFLFLSRPNKTDPAWNFIEQTAQTHGAVFTAIELQPLDEHSSRELVANLLEIEDLPESVRALILQKAEGNPFYVEEVIRSLLDQRLVVRDGAHWRATREIVNIAIPDTLAGVITARLDRLDEEARHTAQTASVLGRDFEYAPLADLYDSAPTLEPSLDTLQARELVRPKRDSALRAYLFKHALTQETAYNSMLLAKRRALHKRAAAYLQTHEAERVNEIARHWLDAQENERALPFILEAADRAARAYATTEAIAYYERAQAIAKQLDDAAALRRTYEGLGNALSFTVELPRAVRVFQEMLEVGKAHDDPLMQISALNKQANLLSLRMGQIEQAEPLLLQAEQLARENQDKPGLGEMYVIRCQISLGTADFDTAMHYMGDAVQVGKDLNVKEQILWGLAHLTSTYTFMLRFEDAEKVAAEGLAMAFDLENREFYCDIKTSEAILLWRRGNFDAAIQAGEDAAQMGERIGLPIMVVFGLWGAGWCYWQRGEYSAAAKAFENAFRVAQPFAEFMPFLITMAEAPLGSVLFESGVDRERALALHKDALTLSNNPIAGMVNSAAWADIGWRAMILGDVELAQRLFSGALEYPSFFRVLMRPRNLLGLAQLAQGRGDFAAADKYIAEAREISDARVMKPFQAMVALAQGALESARGNHGSALGFFDEAEARAATMNLRPTILDARRGAAASQDALGHTQEANEKRAQANAMTEEIAALFSTSQLSIVYLRHHTTNPESQIA